MSGKDDVLAIATEARHAATTRLLRNVSDLSVTVEVEPHSRQTTPLVTTRADGALRHEDRTHIVDTTADG